MDSPQCISEQFFGYIMNTMRVFERQIEFIIIFQHLKAFFLYRQGTSKLSAIAVHVDRNVFGEFAYVNRTIVIRIAVRNEPRHFLSLMFSIIFLSAHWQRWSIFHEVSIRTRHITVPAVVSCPIKYIGVAYGFIGIWGFGIK